MRYLSRLSLAALAGTLLTSLTPLTPQAQATSFGQMEVDQNRFVLTASPIGNGSRHQLLIIEQVQNTRPCWQVIPDSPTRIDPLLLGFNFSGICDRKTDSNGYSLRIAGVDLGLNYRLSIVRRNGQMLLVGQAFRSGPELLIAKADGETTGFAKLELQPGWRLGRRTFQGQALGHIYLVSDQIPAGLALQGAPSTPRSVVAPTPAPTAPAPVTPTPIRPTPTAQPLRPLTPRTPTPNTAITPAPATLQPSSNPSVAPVTPPATLRPLIPQRPAPLKPIQPLNPPR